MSLLDDLMADLRVRPAAKRKKEQEEAARAAVAPVASAASSSAGGAGAAAAAAAAAGAPHALKLIDVVKGKLQLCREGGDLLQSMDPRQALNLMFIFGNARSGKSFMMNQLMRGVGLSGLFTVVNSSTPCTRGVDLSSAMLRHRQLTAHLGLPEPAGISPMCGFVDVEGQGAEDGTYDTMMALPLLLTSRVVLFNHKGAPTVTDMLTKLGVLARAADYIQLTEGDDEDEKAEEKKEEKKAPAKGEAKAAGGEAPKGEAKEAPKKAVTVVRRSGKKFGHLHVLFRDFAFTGDEHAIYEQLLGKEKVVKALRPEEANMAKAAQERNDIRHMLLENFESIRVHLFKQPGSPDDLREHKELPPHLIDPSFTATVNELLLSITEQMGEPTTFNGSNVTGPRLRQLMAQISTTLNEGSGVNVPSVYRAMEKETITRAAKDCMLDVQDVAAIFRKRMPMPPDTLATKLEGVRITTLEDFDAALEDCNMEEDKKKTKADLSRMMADVFAELIEVNSTSTVTITKRAIEKEFGVAKTEMESFCSRRMPMADTTLLDRQHTALLQAAMTAIGKALVKIPNAVSLPEYKVSLAEHEFKLNDYVAMKKVENESLNKDVALAGLRQEADKSKRQLEEQNTRLTEILAREKKHAEEIKVQLERARESEAKAKAKIDEAQRTTEMLQARLVKVGEDKEEEERRAREALERIADERKVAAEKEAQLKVMRERTEEDNKRTTRLLEQIEASRKQIKDALSDKDTQLTRLKKEKEDERAGLEEHKRQIAEEKKRQAEMALQLARVRGEKEDEERKVVDQLRTIDGEKKAALEAMKNLEDKLAAERKQEEERAAAARASIDEEKKKAEEERKRAIEAQARVEMLRAQHVEEEEKQKKTMAQVERHQELVEEQKKEMEDELARMKLQMEIQEAELNELRKKNAKKEKCVIQ